MNAIKILSELKEERGRIDEAILVVERLVAGGGRRRGRPPGWMAALSKNGKRVGRPPGAKNKLQTASVQ